MKIIANLIRVGNIIKYQEKIYQVLNTNTIKPGKGGAFIQVEMRNLLTGVKTHERWRTSENIEKLNTEEIECTYLFKDSESLTLMNKENFEQFQYDIKNLGNKILLLEDGMTLIADYIDNKIINIKFPKSVKIKIESADAVVKGQTASTSFKNAETDNGLRVLVPPHIKPGDKIIINSENFEYIEKSKN